MGTYSEIYIKCHRDKVQQVTTWLKECNINDCFTLKNPDSDYPTFVTDYIKWYGTYSLNTTRTQYRRFCQLDQWVKTHHST